VQGTKAKIDIVNDIVPTGSSQRTQNVATDAQNFVKTNLSSPKRKMVHVDQRPTGANGPIGRGNVRGKMREDAFHEVGDVLVEKPELPLVVKIQCQ